MSELVGRTLELLADPKGGFVSAVKNIFNTRTMATLKISDLSVGDWVGNIEGYGNYYCPECDNMKGEEYEDVYE